MILFRLNEAIKETGLLIRSSLVTGIGFIRKTMAVVVRTECSKD